MATATLSPLLLRTDSGRAAVTAGWCSGLTQKEIMRAFGMKSPSPICQAIAGFIAEHLPDACSTAERNRFLDRGIWRQYPNAYGDRRKWLGKAAVKRYLTKRMI